MAVLSVLGDALIDAGIFFLVGISAGLLLLRVLERRQR